MFEPSFLLIKYGSKRYHHSFRLFSYFYSIKSQRIKKNTIFTLNHYPTIFVQQKTPKTSENYGID